MPLYDYKCDHCNIWFEEFRSVKNRYSVPCPECGNHALKIISIPSGVHHDSVVKDLRGQKIWFPKDGNPYYDKALKRTFNTVHEKKSYMDKKGLAMDGSSDPVKWPVEAGDMRSKSYRKNNRWED